MVHGVKRVIVSPPRSKPKIVVSAKKHLLPNAGVVTIKKPTNKTADMRQRVTFSDQKAWGINVDSMNTTRQTDTNKPAFCNFRQR